MRKSEKGFTLLEALFSMLILSVGIIATLEVHSIALKNRERNRLSLLAQTEIESMMERDRGRLKTRMISGTGNPVEEIFSHTQTSPLSCENLSFLDCGETENGVKVCRAPEKNYGVVKIKYIACIGKNSFRGAQFIHVSRK